MTSGQWKSFTAFRDEYRSLCERWQQFSDELYPIQKCLAGKSSRSYTIETPVVYNRAFDEVCESDEIRYIIVADNPGKEEQRLINQRYLVGYSGKVAKNFFSRTPSLNADFTKNVLVMNKTPIHTANSEQLNHLFQASGETIRKLILETQYECARVTFYLHKGLLENSVSSFPQLWLVGFFEMKKGKVLHHYKENLLKFYKNSEAWNKVFVFKHFSMNRFCGELNTYLKEKQTSDVISALAEIGLKHKDVVFSESF